MSEKSRVCENALFLGVETTGSEGSGRRGRGYGIWRDEGGDESGLDGGEVDEVDEETLLALTHRAERSGPGSRGSEGYPAWLSLRGSSESRSRW